MRRATILMILVSLSGCVSTLPPPTDVELTSTRSRVANCQSLGPVRGDHNLVGGMMYQLAQQAAEAAIMNNAAKLGGNVVLLTSSTAGMMGANMAGTAYRCP